VELAKALEKLGFEQTNSLFFDTIQLKAPAAKVKAIAEAKETNFYYPDAETVSIALHEPTTLSDVNEIVSIFAEVAGKQATEIVALEEDILQNCSVKRTTEFMTDE